MDFGGFTLDRETCRATDATGISLRAGDNNLSISIPTDRAGSLRLLVGDRPVLTTGLAPLHGTANTTIPDAGVFWQAFGQADRLEAGDLSIPLANQAGLRAAMTACRLEART